MPSGPEQSSTLRLLGTLEAQMRELIARLEESADPDVLAELDAKRARATLRVVGGDDAR